MDATRLGTPRTAVIRVGTDHIAKALSGNTARDRVFILARTFAGVNRHGFAAVTAVAGIWTGIIRSSLVRSAVLVVAIVWVANAQGLVVCITTTITGVPGCAVCVWAVHHRRSFRGFGDVPGATSLSAGNTRRNFIGLFVKIRVAIVVVAIEVGCWGRVTFVSSITVALAELTSPIRVVTVACVALERAVVVGAVSRAKPVIAKQVILTKIRGV